jgi:Flp pilus assembly pilin Flp
LHNNPLNPVILFGEIKMKKILTNVLKQEDGATALEYAILVVLIAIVFSVGAAFFGGALRDLFNQTGSSVSDVAPTAISPPAP